jgi:hypothetical protein
LPPGKGEKGERGLVKGEGEWIREKGDGRKVEGEV